MVLSIQDVLTAINTVVVILAGIVALLASLGYIRVEKQRGGTRPDIIIPPSRSRPELHALWSRQVTPSRLAAVVLSVILLGIGVWTFRNWIIEEVSPTSAFVFGQVVVDFGGQPVPGVVVCLDERDQASADITGEYKFRGVSKGFHHIGPDE